jgi:hypothetical protein
MSRWLMLAPWAMRSSVRKISPAGSAFRGHLRTTDETERGLGVYCWMPTCATNPPNPNMHDIPQHSGSANKRNLKNCFTSLGPLPPPLRAEMWRAHMPAPQSAFTSAPCIMASSHSSGHDCHESSGLLAGLCDSKRQRMIIPITSINILQISSVDCLATTSNV